MAKGRGLFGVLLLLFLAGRTHGDDVHYHYRDHHYDSSYGGHHTPDADADANPDYGDNPHYHNPDDYPHYDYGDHHNYYYYGDAGRPDAYYSHGSLLLDDVDAYKEFMAMDSLEACVVGVFDNVETFEESEDHKVFSEIAGDHSHMMRFAHTNNPKVMQFLEMREPGVFLYPAARLAANHPNAGARIHYPGKRLIKDALEKFLLMESAPHVGQYDWRAGERADAVDIPILVVFAKVDELHHSYHHSYEDVETGEEEQWADGGGGGGGGGDEGEEGGAKGGPVLSGEGAVNVAWDFDSIAAALRPVGIAFRHDINILVADKRAHGYEMRNYHLSCESIPPAAACGSADVPARFFLRSFFPSFFSPHRSTKTNQSIG